MAPTRLHLQTRSLQAKRLALPRKMSRAAILSLLVGEQMQRSVTLNNANYLQDLLTKHPTRVAPLELGRLLREAVRQHGERALNAVTALLAHGAALDERDEHGCTALSYTLHAVNQAPHTFRTGSSEVPQEGWFFMVPEMALCLGPSKTDSGGTPEPRETLAFLRICQDVLVKLVQAGADTRVPLGHGRSDGLERWADDQATANWLAVLWVTLPVNAGLHADPCGDPAWERVLTMVKDGADPNWRDARGATLLFHAAGTGRTWAVERLLELGSDSSIRNDNGQTAAEWAASRHQPATAAWLHEQRLRNEAPDAPASRSRVRL